MAQKFCHECGKPLSPEVGRKFCSHCGTNITDLTAARPVAPPPVQRTTQASLPAWHGDDSDEVGPDWEPPNLDRLQVEINLPRQQQNETIGNVIKAGIDLNDPSILKSAREGMKAKGPTKKFMKAQLKEAMSEGAAIKPSTTERSPGRE